MRSVFISLLLLILLGGCQSYPRYRTGEAKNPNSENKTGPNKSNLTDKYYTGGRVGTTDLLNLGRLIQSYLGRPYKGTSKYEKGLDCSQFTQEVYKKFNKTRLPRTSAKQFKTGIKVNQRDLTFGDLVFFRTNGTSVSHVGIYVGFDEFVHVSTSSGVRISSLRLDYWKKRYVGGRRYFQ